MYIVIEYEIADLRLVLKLYVQLLKINVPVRVLVNNISCIFTKGILKRPDMI